MYNVTRHIAIIHHDTNMPLPRGNAGDEVVDENFRFANARRRSNSSSLSHQVSDLKTKFEFNEPEPVFEESVHGPLEEDNNSEDLSKTDTSESSA